MFQGKFHSLIQVQPLAAAGSATQAVKHATSNNRFPPAPVNITATFIIIFAYNW
jgi:hypothetical protein